MNPKLESYRDEVKSERYKDGFNDAIALNLHGRFLNWCADNSWWRNGKRDEWYQLMKQNENKTTADLFQLFINETKLSSWQ